MSKSKLSIIFIKVIYSHLNEKIMNILFIGSTHAKNAIIKEPNIRRVKQF